MVNIQVQTAYSRVDVSFMAGRGLYSARRQNMSAPRKSRACARLTFGVPLGLQVALACITPLVALGAGAAVGVAGLDALDTGSVEVGSSVEDGALGVSPSVTMRMQLPNPPLDWNASVHEPFPHGRPPGMRTTIVSTPSASLDTAWPFWMISSGFWNEPGAPVSDMAALKNVEPSLPLRHTSKSARRYIAEEWAVGTHEVKCLAKTVTVPSGEICATFAGPL